MQILMPEINKDSIRNRLVKWLKKENDLVEIGEEIALIENQRVTSVIKSPSSGRLVNMLQENSFINVGQQVAEVIENNLLKEQSSSEKVTTGSQSGSDVILQVDNTKEDEVIIPGNDSLSLKCRVDISRSLFFVHDNSIRFSSYLFFCISKAYSKYPFLGKQYPINFLELSEVGLEKVDSYSDDLLNKIESVGLSSLDEFFKKNERNIDFSLDNSFNVIHCENIALENVRFTFYKKSSAILACFYNISEDFENGSREECNLFFSSNFGMNLSDILNFIRKLKSFLTKPENLVL